MCKDHHSTRLVMAILTDYAMRFSDHRMARYFSLNILPKMKFFTNFANFDMQIYQGVSSSIGRRDMYYSLLDSSRQGASNNGRFISLASPDEMLFVFYCFLFF